MTDHDFKWAWKYNVKILPLPPVLPLKDLSVLCIRGPVNWKLRWRYFSLLAKRGWRSEFIDPDLPYLYTNGGKVFLSVLPSNCPFPAENVVLFRKAETLESLLI